MSKEKKLSKKALYSDELGKIGRAAERGGPVNKVQEKHREFSEKQMAYNKVKNEPIRQKLAGIGVGLVVAAATNPELGRGVQKLFTGNPVTNVKDMATRQRMIQQNMRQSQEFTSAAKRDADFNVQLYESGKYPSGMASHPSMAGRGEYLKENQKVWTEAAKKENVYKTAVKTANEDMALIQTNRIMQQALKKEIKLAIKYSRR